MLRLYDARSAPRSMKTPDIKSGVRAYRLNCLIAHLIAGCPSQCGRSFVQNAVVNGKQREFEAVGNADLVVHVPQIILNHLLRGSKLNCDFLVLEALDD